MIKTILTPILVISIALQGLASRGVSAELTLEEQIAALKADHQKVVAPILEELKQAKFLTAQEQTRLTPAQLAKYRWAQAKYSMKEYKKNPAILNDLPEEIRSLVKPEDKPVKMMLAGILAVYIGMGVVAGIKTLTNSSTDPRAINDAIDKFLDLKYQAALFGGSFITYKLFAKASLKERVFTESYIRNSPMSPARSSLIGHLWATDRFTGAFAFMSVVVTPFATMIRDQKLMSCIGASKESEPGDCDAAVEFWFKSPKGLMAILPTVVRLVAAGMLTQIIMASAAAVVTQRGIAAGLTAFEAIARAGGPLWMIASFVVFYFTDEVLEQLIGFDQGAKKIQTAWWTFENDDLGPTVRESQKLVMHQWSSLRKTNWANYVPKIQNEICEKKKVGLANTVDCYNDPHPDFLALLDNYHNRNQAWRGALIAPVQIAYSQWQSVITNYSEQYKATHEAYLSATEQVKGYWAEKSRTKSEPNVDVVSPLIPFNWLSAKSFMKDSETKYQTEVLEKLKNIPNAKTAEQKREELKTLIFKDMNRPKDADWELKVGDIPSFGIPGRYLLLSMTCGPEAENYKPGKSSPLTKLSNFKAARFLPPKITIANDTEFCRQRPLEFHINGFKFEKKGEIKNGVTKYLIENLRPEIFNPATGENNFTNWWDATVLPQVNETYANFRQSYKALLEKELIPALNNTDYICFNEHLRNEEDSKSLPVSSDLEDKLVKKGKCDPHATQLAKGVFNSINDELNLYLRILKDIYITKYGKEKAPEFVAAGQRLSKALIEYEKTMSGSFDETMSYRQARGADDPLFEDSESLEAAKENLKVTMGFKKPLKLHEMPDYRRKNLFKPGQLLAPIKEENYPDKTNRFKYPEQTKETKYVVMDNLFAPVSESYMDDVMFGVLDRVDKLLKVPGEFRKALILLNPR